MQHKNRKKADFILKILGELIKEERIKQNKSQRLLADEYEIQKSMLSRIESGTNEIKLISLFTICESLNLKPSELIKRIEEKIPSDFSITEK